MFMPLTRAKSGRISFLDVLSAVPHFSRGTARGLGLPRRTAHCLRVTCASRLFQNSVEEKLIGERTGHKSDALFF